MDRKKFIKTSSIGLGLAFIPGMLHGQSSKADTLNTNNIRPKIVKKSEGHILNVIGDVQMHKISGEDSNNQIVEWTNDVAPGVGIPPHIHTKEDEIFRVIKGKVELMVGEDVIVLEPGDVAYAPKNIVHSWKIIGTENASMSTSAFPAGIEFMFEELGKLPPGPPDLEKVSEICAKHGISFV
ncbi:MAG: cupin domain-containing protein [Flavobacteriaceae bacterium]|nr:cupin domain-containing protein [Flavobacteriaceae bacterium]